MPSVSFDGINKQIVLSDVGDYTVQDIYSEWKRWVQSGTGAPYAAAFDTTGGDDIGGGTFIGSYFFLRTDNGWTIKLPEASGAVKLTGNLFPRVANAVMFTNPTGSGITVRVLVSTSAQALTVEASSNLTANDVWSEVIETGFSAKDLIRLQAAALAGKLSVSGDTVTIRDVNDTTDRIIATTDVAGQRTAITTNVS